jgi:hypothetical protein
MRGPNGRVGLQKWPERLEAGGHASRPSALAPNWRWLLSGQLSLVTPPHPPVAPHRTPPHANIRASVVTLYVDIYAVPTASYADVYGGQRLAMRGTAIGREASRTSTYVASRAGPDREHVRREPLFGTAVLVRRRADGASMTERARAVPFSGIRVLVRRRADGASMTEHVRREPLSGIAVLVRRRGGRLSRWFSSWVARRR